MVADLPINSVTPVVARIVQVLTKGQRCKHKAVEPSIATHLTLFGVFLSLHRNGNGSNRVMIKNYAD